MNAAPEVYGLIGIAAAAAGISCFFDVLRAVRAATGIPSAVTDALFWIAAAGGMAAALMYFCSGELRGYIIAGAAAGSVLYFFTISRPAFAVFTVIFKFFFDKLHFILKILLTPPRFLYKILYRALSNPYNKKRRR